MTDFSPLPSHRPSTDEIPPPIQTQSHRKIPLCYREYPLPKTSRYDAKRLPSECKTAKTVDARTTDLSLSFTSLLNKQEKRERETNVIDN